MRYGSVCSGIEAASVAWLPLGWQPAFFAEIDAFPSAVLAERWPGVPNLGDFTAIGSDAGPIELLVGGTPCQDFSVAGLRAGMAGERGNLTLEFLRLADRLRPEWLVWENVPGVLSSNGGRDFGAFLGGLAELGYGWAYRVLDAQYIRVESHARAVPQRRRRVFVVGHLGDWRAAAAVLFERNSLSGHPAPSREAGKDVAGTLDARTKAGGFPGTDGAASGHVVAPELSNAICARDYKGARPEADQGAPLVVHSLRAEGFDASEDGTGRGIPLVLGLANTAGATALGVDVECAPPITRRNGDPGNVLCYDDPRRFDARGVHRGGEHGDLHPPVNCTTPPQTLIAFDDYNQSLTGDRAHALRGHRPNDVPGVLAARPRRLTPKECERLQGFPDDYTLIPIGTRRRPAKDGPRYKALGNSIGGQLHVLDWRAHRSGARSPESTAGGRMKKTQKSWNSTLSTSKKPLRKSPIRKKNPARTRERRKLTFGEKAAWIRIHDCVVYNRDPWAPGE